MKAKKINIEFERKKEALKQKVANGVCKTQEWFIRNKDVIVFVTPIVVGGVVKVVKIVGKNVNLRKEEAIKNLYCYDRSLGHYWRLRRELSNKEWLEIDRRRRNGERLANILSDLKVLK